MNKPLILVVDDEKDVANIISEMISKTGKYDTCIANSGTEAIAKIKENKGFLGIGGNKIKLILLDIRMPEMTGIELAEKLHKETDSDIDIIMVTAFDQDDNWMDSVFSFNNVISFIRKPVDRDDLIKHIDAYFSGDRDQIFKDAMAEFLQKDIKKKPEAEQ